MSIKNDSTDVRVSAETLTVTFRDDYQLSVPLFWYPRLLAGTEAERADWELLGASYGMGDAARSSPKCSSGG